MPIFEYRCSECGQVTAFLEPAGRRGRHACEHCGSKSTRKMISTFAPQAGKTPSSRCSTCEDAKCPFSRS